MLLSCKLEVTFKALTRIANQFDFKDITSNFNPKRDGSQFDLPLWFFQNCVFQTEDEDCFFVTFNSSYHKSHFSWTFHWNSSRRSLHFSMLANFISFLDFWYYFVTNKVMASAYNKWRQRFFTFSLLQNRLLNSSTNFIEIGLVIFEICSRV